MHTLFNLLSRRVLTQFLPVNAICVYKLHLQKVQCTWQEKGTFKDSKMFKAGSRGSSFIANKKNKEPEDLSF
jgi:hypothetical protein